MPESQGAHSPGRPLLPPARAAMRQTEKTGGEDAPRLQLQNRTPELCSQSHCRPDQDEGMPARGHGGAGSRPATAPGSPCSWQRADGGTRPCAQRPTHHAVDALPEPAQGAGIALPQGQGGGLFTVTLTPCVDIFHRGIYAHFQNSSPGWGEPSTEPRGWSVQDSG